MSVECQPILCPIPMPVICNEEGEVLVNQTIDCCNEQTCGEGLRISPKCLFMTQLLCLTVMSHSSMPSSM